MSGGASGIGRGTCQVLAREGATVIAVDINKDGLDSLMTDLPGNMCVIMNPQMDKVEIVRIDSVPPGKKLFKVIQFKMAD